MNQPTACAVMLTADRPEMTRRAVECWRAQTYEPKQLLVFDTGVQPCFTPELRANLYPAVGYHLGSLVIKTIGNARNWANCLTKSDIIAHFDSDDWSHPNRLAEQVALLQASGADCVGYREVLFWRTADATAWLYLHADQRYCVGASLCYWRRAWEARPFQSMNVGEDLEWQRGLKRIGYQMQQEPRLIQTLHGGNTWDGDVEARIKAGDREWRRAPEWDEYCRGIFG